MHIVKPGWNWKGTLTPMHKPTIYGISIHHMAHLLAGFREVERWHLDKGWLGFAYNFWISFKGEVIEGRGFNQGAGVLDVDWTPQFENASLIHIGLQGDFGKQSPTQEQLSALTNLISWLKPQLPGLLVIKGHSYWNSTECPGKNFPIGLFEMGDIKQPQNGGKVMLLKKGHKGAEVVELQKELVKIGYAIAVDGDFGLQTEAVIKAFQYNVMGPGNDDGVVGPLTRGAIQDMVSKSDIQPIAPEAPVVPISEPDWKGKYSMLSEELKALVGKIEKGEL